MKYHDWIKGREAELYIQAKKHNAFYQEFEDVKAVDAARFEEAFNQYAELYEITSKKVDCTKTIVAGKNAAKKELKYLMRMMYGKYVRTNEEVDEAQRIAADFPVIDNKKHPSHLKTDAPHINIDFGQSQYHLIYFFDTTEDGESRAAIPKNCSGVQIWFFVGENEPIDATSWRFWGLAPKSPAKIIYDPLMRGQKVWYRLRWYNTQNEVSAWSEVVNAIIN